MRRAEEKLYTEERGTFCRGPTRKQRYRRGKSLAFSKDRCLKKERVRSKVTPRKVGVGLKRRRKLNKRRLACWGSTEKKKASHLIELR